MWWMEDVHAHECPVASDLNRVRLIAGDGVDVARLDGDLLCSREEDGPDGLDLAGLLMGVALLGHDGTGSMEVLIAHLRNGR